MTLAWIAVVLVAAAGCFAVAWAIVASTRAKLEVEARKVAIEERKASALPVDDADVVPNDLELIAQGWRDPWAQEQVRAYFREKRRLTGSWQGARASLRLVTDE